MRRGAWGWCLGGTMGLALLACQAAPMGSTGGAAAPGGAASTGQAQAGGKAPGAAVASGAKRVAKRLPAPAAGQVQKLSQYWDFEPSTPWEIEDTRIEAAGVNAQGATVTKLQGEVKTLSKALGAKFLAALQAKGTKLRLLAEDEEGHDHGEDLAASGAEGGSPEVASEAGASPAGELEPWQSAAYPEDADPSQIEEEISFAADDEDGTGFVTDEDGDGELEEGEGKEAGEDSEAFPEALENRILGAPHVVKGEVLDFPPMSEQEDELRFTDEKTQQALVFKASQDFTRFGLSLGSKTHRLERMPDGSWMLDGVAVGTIEALATKLGGMPEAQALGLQPWAMASAYLARMPLAGANRGAGVAGALLGPVQGVTQVVGEVYRGVGNAAVGVANALDPVTKHIPQMPSWFPNF